MSASGQEVLHTAGKLCEDDITIDYTQPGGGGANLQTKSVTYTPDETGISDTILPDPGYDGLDEVDVTVDAIPDTYVGSAVPQRDSTSLTSTGQVVHVPAGYYASAALRGVNNGTAGTPTASKGAVNNHSVDVTPSVTNTTGWITGGTQTGTPVTVTAAELVSGSQTVTVNDTYDVTNLAEMVVNVSGGGSTYQSGNFTLAESAESTTITISDPWDILFVWADSSPYGTGIRTFMSLIFDNTKATQKVRELIVSNAAGSSLVGYTFVSYACVSISGGTVTLLPVTNYNYNFIAGIQYNWIAI